MKQEIQHAVDGAAMSVTLAAVLGWLPSISAALGIVWFVLQIAEKLLGRPLHTLWRKRNG